jgi:hypothetical protein
MRGGSVTGGVISGNTSEDGGGIDIVSGDLYDVVVEDNVATGWGGGCSPWTGG